MAVNTANVNVSTDTFNDWLQKTNNIASIISNSAVTANTSLGITTGNAYVNGYFSANTLIAQDGIRGGNNSTANVLVIAAGFSSNTSTYVAGIASLTGTSQQLVDTFPIVSYRTSKYVLQVNTAYGYQATELMLLQDGSANVIITEYATLTTNGSMGTFSSSIASGNVNLYVTPTQAVSTVSFQRTSLAV
jgi:hypothetical protein